jgi:hypothetical protein
MACSTYRITFGLMRHPRRFSRHRLRLLHPSMSVVCSRAADMLTFLTYPMKIPKRWSHSRLRLSHRSMSTFRSPVAVRMALLAYTMTLPRKVGHLRFRRLHHLMSAFRSRKAVELACLTYLVILEVVEAHSKSASTLTSPSFGVSVPLPDNRGAGVHDSPSGLGCGSSIPAGSFS